MKKGKNTSRSDHFWKLRGRKSAVVARSTFPSQNVQSTPFSDHFWQLRCQKSARRCGAKPISKSKCTKHTILRPLLAVEMSKKCTPLWREAGFQVKSAKKLRVVGPLLDVQMWKKCTLTNLTSLSNLSNLTFLTNLTNLTY